MPWLSQGLGVPECQAYSISGKNSILGKDMTAKENWSDFAY